MTRPCIGRVESPGDIARVLREKWRVFRFYAGDQPLAGPLLRWGFWAIRCLLRWPAIVGIPRYEMRLALLPRWKGCWKAIYVFRERFFEVADPELAYVQRRLRPGDVFVDAGAYHGWYTLVASRAVGERGRVVAFEPNPAAFEILTQNLALNGCGNVKALRIALSDADGDAWFYQDPNDGAASSLGRIPGWRGQERVATRRLDGVLEEIGVRAVTVMKVDVEGSEANLLRGAVGVLTTCRPVVIFELNPAAAATMGVPERAAWDALEALGYAFFRFSTDALIPLSVFPRVPPGKWMNIVAVHSTCGRVER